MGQVRSRLIVLHSFVLLAVGVLLATGWWRGASSSRASSVVTLGLWALSALACAGAARRAARFGRQFWMLMATAFSISLVGSLLSAYYGETHGSPIVNLWVFFLFPAPFAMALLLDRDGGVEGIDWQQMLDFVQICIIALSAFLIFVQFPTWVAPSNRALVAGTLRLHLVRDALLAGAFLLCSRYSGRPDVRALFRRMGIFLVSYGAGSVLFFYGQGHWQLPPHNALVDRFAVMLGEVVNWGNNVFAVLLAATWSQPQESESWKAAAPRRNRMQRAQYLPLLFPLVVLALASRISQQHLVVAWIGVGASILCSVARAAVAERRQQDALKLLGQTFRASPNAILITTLAGGRILDVNEGFTRMIGYSREEAVGRTTFDLKIWVDRTERDMLVAVLRERGMVNDLEARFRRKSGELRVALISGALIEYGRETCLLGYAMDITDRQRAEEERQRLLVSEGEARHTAEVLSLANLALTQHLSLEAVLDTFLEHVHRLVPYDSANVMLVEDEHTFAVRALHGYEAQDRDAVLRIRFDLRRNRITERLFRTRKSILVPDTQEDADWEIVRGAEHVRNWLGVPLLAGGKVIGMYSLDKREPGFFSEAHMQLAESLAAQAAAAIQNALLFEERRQAGEALQRSEARYRDLIENANDIICTLDLSEQFTSLNRIGERITGHKVVPGREVRIADIVVPEHLERARELFRRAVAGEIPEVNELEIVNPAAERVTLELSGRALYEAGRPSGVQVIARDVTSRKRLEMQLQQSQKLEAIGLLAGGVAHDFNTLLGVICGQCELISLQSNLDNMLRTRIEEIAQVAQRAAELTRQLLAFSRKQLLHLRVLDLNANVTEMATPLRRLIGEHITLVTRLAPDLGRIKADPSQIEQVIINLAVNARDAMPQGGTLILETAKQELDEEFARHHASVMPGRYAMLTVSDTGVGINKESMAHIFEPFYTTKEMGKGTGLGLATVYGMIKQSGGHIAVHSVPGRGTTFAIYFPLVAEEAQTEKSEVRPLTATPRKETILLVEDEATLRELVRACLQQAGYTVLVAADGYEAMEIASRHPGEIDLLLTDVVMPGLSGLEVARRLREQRPQTKVLYVSGYLDAATLAPESLGADVAFLEKPFRLQALTRKLREVLGHKPD